MKERLLTLIGVLGVVFLIGIVFLSVRVDAQAPSLWFPNASDLPEYVIGGVSDGCAEWSSNVLTTTGSACGSGGGAAATWEIDANGLLAPTTSLSIAIPSTSTSTFAGGIEAPYIGAQYFVATSTSATSTFAGDVKIDGAVGIGTFNPDADLEVYRNQAYDGTVNSMTQIRVNNPSASGFSAFSIWGNGAERGRMQFNAASPNIFFTTRGQIPFYIGTNDNIRLTVKGDNGFIGLNETSPGSRLSVSGNATVGAGYDTTAAPTNGLLVEGNVGIGTTTPGQTLSVAGDVLGNEIIGSYFTATTTATSTFTGGSIFSRVNTSATSTLGGAVIETGGLQITSLASCNTLDTDSNGVIVCGTDETASGGSFFGQLDDVATSSSATGDIFYQNASGQVTNLGLGASSTVLTTNGTLPNWGTVSFSELGGLLDLTSQVTGELPDANVSNTLTVSAGTVTWSVLDSYPTGCTNQFVRTIDDTLTCASVTTSDITDNTIAFADIDHSITLAGNPALGASEAYFSTTGIIFEGSSADTNELLLDAADPASDITVTIPNVTGTLASLAGTQSFTGTKTFPDSVLFGNALTHTGDTDTQILYTADQIVLTAGGVTAITIAESTSDIITFGSYAVDAGGVLSFEIPNGTAPTVDALGEIALDTTDNQLLIATSSGVAVFPTTQKIWGVTVASTSPAFIEGTTLPVPTQLDGYSITAIRCKVDGGTSKVIAVEDASANTTEDITCAATVTSDDGTIDNQEVTAAEEMYLDFGATSGTVNYVTVSVFGVWLRE